MSQPYSIFLAQTLNTKATGAVVPRCTQLNTVGVSITEPDGQDLTREGRRFCITRNAAVTGIAPVQAQVTTAAQWVLFNTSSTKTCFFDMLGMALDSGVGGATGHTIYACDFTTPAQTGLATGLFATSMSGSSTATSALSIKSGVTVTAPAAPFWYPVAFVSSAITPGILGTTIANWEIRGRIALQPGHGLGLVTYGAAGTTPLFGPVAQWVELESNMG